MDEFEEIKSNLDSELDGTPENVGIAFGVELFEIFRRRNWFTLESFSALGTTAFSEKIPAYKNTHFAFPSWDLEDYSYKVGKVSKSN